MAMGSQPLGLFSLHSTLRGFLLINELSVFLLFHYLKFYVSSLSGMHSVLADSTAQTWSQKIKFWKSLWNFFSSEYICLEHTLRRGKYIWSLSLYLNWLSKMILWAILKLPLKIIKHQIVLYFSSNLTGS